MSDGSDSLIIDKTRPFNVGDWLVDAQANQIQLDDKIVGLEPN